MPRRLRFIPPGGSLVEVTTRTIQGRLLLKPSAELELIILGVLGRAQRLYRVKIHEFVFMSNHFHLLLTVETALQLARFMGYFNGNLAKEVARLTGWRDKVWSRRYQAVLVSEEEEAQIARMRYLFSHGVKENLVGSPRDWPGASSLKAHLGQACLVGTWYDRTSEYESKRRSGARTSAPRHEQERVILTPLPCLSALSPDERTNLILEIVSEIEELAAVRHKAGGTQPLTPGKVLRQGPTEKPRRSKRSPAPFAHCASRRARKLLWRAYGFFLAVYLDARETQRAGGAAVFPEGSFPSPRPFIEPIPEPG